ncbi:MAG TPA: tyrosine-type recombinase/integrase [Allosphingosinicella sp.]|jgi:integrase
MAKTLTETQITTRRARAALAAGLHWRGLDPDIHLGYRKAKRGGRWLVRWYSGGQHYQQETLGTADDLVGQGNLSFEEASRLARQIVVDSRKAAEEAALYPPMSVRDAVVAYIAARDARHSALSGRSLKSDAHRLTRYVLGDPMLADRELRSLSEVDFKGWQERLTTLRSGGKERVVNDFKAALNACFLNHRRSLPPDLPVTIKYGLKLDIDWADRAPVARANQILPDDRVRQILAEAQRSDTDGDFALLVVVLAATGARFSQVKRMRVRDAQLAQSRLFVPSSRKGKARAPSFIRVQIGPDVVEALSRAIAGRETDDPLLEHWRYRQTAPQQWVRNYRGPWGTSSEMTRKWNQVVAAVGLPGIIPYALRHSSIVRGIRSNLPIRLVAALHDTSVVMIERHYSRWITEGLEELAARAVVPLLAA